MVNLEIDDKKLKKERQKMEKEEQRLKNEQEKALKQQRKAKAPKEKAPPKLPISVKTPGIKVDLTCSFICATASYPRCTSTPASL